MPNVQLTAEQAGEIAYRARRLRSDGRITCHDYAVLDALLWSARAPGRDTTQPVAYSLLAKMAGVGRSTVALAIKRLVSVGLIEPIKRRALVALAHGGRVWRQLTSAYRLIHRESAVRPDSKSTDIYVSAVEPPPVALRAAQAALAAIRAQMEARLALR